MAVLTISERGSKYSQVGQNSRSHCVEEASMFGLYLNGVFKELPVLMFANVSLLIDRRKRLE